MKVSAKGFVQIHSGKGFIADIKLLCHLGPFVVYSVIFRYWNICFVSMCCYCIIFGFHCTVVVAKV